MTKTNHLYATNDEFRTENGGQISYASNNLIS